MGAGTFFTTRPARSKREPWHGQRNPPGACSSVLSACAVIQPQGRCATQVRAHADGDEVLGMQGSRRIGTRRRLLRALGQRIGERGIRTLKRADHLLAASQEPDGPATPCDRTQFPGCQPGEVARHRPAPRPVPRGRLHAGHEGVGRGREADTSHDLRCRQQELPTIELRYRMGIDLINDLGNGRHGRAGEKGRSQITSMRHPPRRTLPWPAGAA